MPRRPRNRADLTTRNLPPLKRMQSEVIALKKQYKRLAAMVYEHEQRLGRVR